MSPILHYHIIVTEGIVQVAARLGISALECGPQNVSKNLRYHSSNIAMPRLGYDGNYAFSTFQINIASTKRASDVACWYFFICDLDLQLIRVRQRRNSQTTLALWQRCTLTEMITLVDIRA